MKRIAERLTEIEYYPNQSWVKHQGARVLKPNGTNTPTDFVWSYVERRDALNYTGNPVWTAKQHLMSNNVPQRKIDENTDWQGVDWSVTGVNGAQQPTLTIRYLNGGGVSDVRTWQEFSYDNGMRMTDQKYLYALNGAGLSAPTFTLSNQVYNYKDQLIEKNIGYRGTNNALQSIDYQYNTRGWLTGINTVGLSGGASSLLTPSMQGTGGITNLAITPFLNTALQQQVMEALPPMTDTNVDLFSQTLTYDTPDNRTGAASQKNGNISSTVWQVAGRDRQAYGFTYDDLNRLTEAKYYDIIGTQSTVSTDNKFSEKQTYDLRGNITTLKRNGLNGGSWTSNGYTAGTYGLIDDLTYTYGTGNQLAKVRDVSLLDKGFKSVNNPNSTQYTYDANGNLKSDLNKGITNIEYNVLNLPQVITFTNNRQLQWVYDASGAKLRKMVLENGSVKETRDYVNGVEYKNRLLERVSHSEGAVVLNEYGNDQHEYVLRDHLGNTRVTFRDGTNKGTYFDWNTWSYKNLDPNYDDGLVTKDDIVQINNYYPFGLNMEGDWNGAPGNNKFQYNEKEWNDDFGLGWNDYGARFYDPAMARWQTIDPLSEKMRRHSPYNYAFDNPMRFIDPDGNAPEESGAPSVRVYAIQTGDASKDENATRTVTHETTIVNKDGSAVVTSISATINNSGTITAYSKLETTSTLVSDENGIREEKSVEVSKPTDKEESIVGKYAVPISDKVQENSNYVRDAIISQNSESTGKNWQSAGAVGGVLTAGLTLTAGYLAMAPDPTGLTKGAALLCAGGAVVTGTLSAAANACGNLIRDHKSGSASGELIIYSPTKK